MRLKGGLTRPEVDRLRDLCNFTADESAVFDLLVQGKTIVEISMCIPASTATVERRMRAIRAKIARVTEM